MGAPNQTAARTLRFGVFEVDLASRELRKRGVRVKLQDQPFRVLEALLEKPGAIVTREQLKDRLWAHDEFVEFDKSLNTAVQKIRLALGDSANAPRYLETLPKVGYRFVASAQAAAEPPPGRSPRTKWLPAVAVVAIASAVGLWWINRPAPRPFDPSKYSLRQLTRDDGLTFQATLSPDGKLIAYASDRDGQGNLDIYVQQVSGGSATRITDHPADDYQPDFSPGGERLVFRSERDGGGVYTIRSVGDDTPRPLAKGGYNPRFSPDGQMIAFYRGYKLPEAKLYVMGANGGEETRLAGNLQGARLPIWTPDSSRLLFHGWGPDADSTGDWFTCALDGSDAVPAGSRSRAEVISPELVGTSFHHGAGPVPIPSAWLPGVRAVIFGARSGDDGRLWVQRFNAGYKKAEGLPEPITFGTRAATDPVASQTGVIAFAELDIGGDLLGLSLDEPGGKPELLVPNINLFPQSFASVSSDGSRVAYISRKAGQLDVKVIDLATGATTDVTDTPEEEDRVSISPDGKLVAIQDGDAIAVAAVDGGPVRNLCSGCPGEVGGWSADSRQIVTEGRRLTLLDVQSGAMTGLFEDSLPLWQPRMTPDGRWMAFIQPVNAAGERDFSVRRLFVAEIREGALVPKDKWIAITDGADPEGYGAWSADASALYYWRVRDDAKIIYRQPLDLRTKRPVRQREEVHRFTEFDERFYGQGISPHLAASRNRLVFPMLRLRSNIWIMEPKDVQ